MAKKAAAAGKPAAEKLRKGRDLQRGYMGWVFIAPWIIGFLVFKLYPFASSLVWSFSDFHLLSVNLV